MRTARRLLLLLAVLWAGAPRVAGAAEDPPPAPPPDLEAPSPRYEGTDPNRNPQGHRPFAVVSYPREIDARLRGVKVTPGAIELVQGGRLVGRIPFMASVFSPATFEDVARAVGDPEWIAEVAPGVFGVRAAIVLAQGSAVRFAAPGTKELRLATSPPGVFLGGVGATTMATLDGVKITSWDLNLRRPSEDLTIARPFVLFEESARLDINRSELGYLGSDRVGSYGVAWRKGGASGSVTDSVFHHNFFGVYTYEASGLVFSRNVFRDNIYYGLDPHDRTYGLVAEDNEAYGNGSHGIIFSRDVSDGIIRRNRSHHNKGNGIVLDAGSNRNHVEDNDVNDNGLDGIVLLGSSSNTLAGNRVAGNRVGIRANKPGLRNHVLNNRLDGNEVGVEAYGGAAELLFEKNVLSGNTKAGYVLDAPASVVSEGRVEGGARGFDVRAPAKIGGVLVTGVREGVRVRAGGTVELSGLAVDAARQGVRVDPGGSARLRTSTLRASPHTAGAVRISAGNDFVEEPEATKSAWLAVAGLAALECAVLLELLQHMRERRHGLTRRRSRRSRLPRAARKPGGLREAHRDVA